MLGRFLKRKDAAHEDADPVAENGPGSRPTAAAATPSVPKPAPAAATYSITIRSLGQTIEGAADKTLLDAALDADLVFPHNCCAGDCGTCLCRIISGEVVEQIDTGHLIDDDERSEGWVLGCQALPKSDVEVEIPDD